MTAQPMTEAPKRFALFAGDFYYPCGGWDDFEGTYDTKELALEAAMRRQIEGCWWHIVDLTTGEFLKKG